MPYLHVSFTIVIVHPRLVPQTQMTPSSLNYLQSEALHMQRTAYSGPELMLEPFSHAHTEVKLKF
jgi:hypothetical protein